MVLGLVGGLAVLTLTVAALVGVVANRGAAQSAADLSALAAAAAVQHGEAEPCLQSARVAERNSAQVVRCTCGPDRSCTVEVSRASGLGPATVAAARAGPAAARPSR